MENMMTKRSNSTGEIETWTTDEPSVTAWSIKRRNEGQMVQYAVGYDEDGYRYERRVDRSCDIDDPKRVTYRAADADAD